MSQKVPQIKTGFSRMFFLFLLLLLMKLLNLFEFLKKLFLRTLLYFDLSNIWMNI